MYQYVYGEILADSPVDSRAQERAVLERAIDMLRAAQGSTDARLRGEALTFTSQLWNVFIADLAHPENDLPPDLRARLMSIGLWIMSEVVRIENRQSDNFEGIAAICGMIRDGLR